jgi:hypothetical protein
MLQNLLIPIGIMVVLSLLGWLTQMLKNAQLKQEAERERQRRESMPVATPTGRGNSGPKAPASDIDRFLAEIDRLRQKGGATSAPKPAAKAAPVPTVVPVKKQRLADAPQPAPFVTTAAPPQGSSRSAPINREDLPVATVVGSVPPQAPRVQPTGTSPPTVTRPPAKVRAAVGSSVTRTAVVQTPFGQQLVALLSSPQSVPMAVVLAEILGDPKCKQKI